MTKLIFFIVFFIAVNASIVHADEAKAELGQLLYFDKNLSLNRSQSCASCHNPAVGFVDDRGTELKGAASLGDNGQSIGDRNAPTAAYAAFSPDFHFNSKTQQYVGGQFWDGRAKNLQAQASAPLLNPNEMGLTSTAMVKQRLRENQHYVLLFKNIYGDAIFNHNNSLFKAMTESIAAFEQSAYFSPFDSKYDRYLNGNYELSAQEELGMSLFFSNNNTNCASCHVLKGENQTAETFTNYEFHNIGVPVNSPLRGINGVKKDHLDTGLLENPLVEDDKHAGKFKVPTLRNVALTAPYMHNGVFKELSTVIEFYDQYNNSKRVLNPETQQPWREAEIKDTINKKDLKAKRLSDAKIKALVAFLTLLNDQRYEQ